WEEAALKVYAPMWGRLLDANRNVLKGITPILLPGIASNVHAFARDLLGSDAQPAKDDEGRQWLAGAVIGAALALGLHERGWALDVAPGSGVSLRRDEQILEPFNVLDALCSKKIAADEWLQRCTDWDIRSLDFGTVATH